MKIITLIALQVWILENDDVMRNLRISLGDCYLHFPKIIIFCPSTCMEIIPQQSGNSTQNPAMVCNLKDLSQSCKNLMSFRSGKEFCQVRFDIYLIKDLNYMEDICKIQQESLKHSFINFRHFGTSFYGYYKKFYTEGVDESIMNLKNK